MVVFMDADRIKVLTVYFFLFLQSSRRMDKLLVSDSTHRCVIQL